MKTSVINCLVIFCLVYRTYATLVSEDYDDGDYDDEIIQAYVTPCLVNCTNGADFNGDGQAKAIVKGLQDYFDSYFTWINIDRNQPWSADQMKNRKFLTDLINTLFDLNGPNFTVIDKAPFLLWVNWNGKKDLTTDFTQFGGWMTEPDIFESADVDVADFALNAIELDRMTSLEVVKPSSDALKSEILNIFIISLAFPLKRTSKASLLKNGYLE
uniref:Uncharacterized protein n=1 Tax=Acrobeloides nanus TaxID=290746 RepID=A0A914CGN4_9BILA